MPLLELANDAWLATGGFHVDYTAGIRYDAANTELQFYDAINGAVNLGTLANADLQRAYNNGGTILTTVVGGAITLQHGGGAAVNLLSINDLSALASTVALVAINCTSNTRTTGHLLSIANAGTAFTGHAIDIVFTDGGAGFQGIVMEDQTAVANGQPLIYVRNLNNARTAGLMNLVQNGTAFTGGVLDIDMGGNSTTYQAIVVTDASLQAVTTALVHVVNAGASARVTGPLMCIEQDSNAFGTYAFHVQMNASNIAQQAILVEENLAAGGANTTALIEVSSINDERTTGPLMRISGAGDLLSGALLNIVFPNTCAAPAPWALYVQDQSTGNRTAPLVEFTSTNANWIPVGVGDPLLALTLNAASEATVPYIRCGTTNFFVDAGVPNNANGNNDDYFFRVGGGAGAALYVKAGGNWVAIA